jgi:CII-binding regulator of phage lambda lysogenization HflD
MKVIIKNEDKYLVFSMKEVKKIIKNSIKEVEEYNNILNEMWNTNEYTASDMFDNRHTQLKFGVELFLHKIEKVCPRIKGYRLDITKIKVNKKFENLVIKHDKKLLKITNSELTKNGINREYSFIYLNYSFSIDNELDDFVIFIDKEVYKSSI